MVQTGGVGRACGFKPLKEAAHCGFKAPLKEGACLKLKVCVRLPDKGDALSAGPGLKLHAQGSWAYLPVGDRSGLRLGLCLCLGLGLSLVLCLVPGRVRRSGSPGP